MSGGESDSRGRRSRAEALAADLRAVCEALAVCELDGEVIEAGAQLASELRRVLTGPRRGRWYDGDPNAVSGSGSSRRAYLDQSPIRGALNPVAPPLELEVVERADGSRAIRGRARLGMAYEGPPRGVHGGWVAALFDDVLGATHALAERPGVTGILRVKYRAITPLDEELRFAGWVADERGRRVVARATCHAGETLTAEAEGLFVRVDWAELERRSRTRA